MWIRRRTYERLKSDLRRAKQDLAECQEVTELLHLQLIETQRELRDCQETNMSTFNGRYQSPQKSDGTANAGGKVYFYETGTSTLKSVYTDDALTTAHANPVILDSAGAALIFLGTGSYDYKVDDSNDAAVVTTQGPVIDSSMDNYLLTSAIAWTVDGVGATSTTFSTISLAMDEARLYIIMRDGGLTITVNNGTYTDESIDFSHPQGAFISVIGQSMAATFIRNTQPGTEVLNIGENVTLNEFSGFTLQQSGTTSSNGFTLPINSTINTLDITVDSPAGANTTTGATIFGNVFAGNLVINDFAYGVLAGTGSTKFTDIRINDAGTVGLWLFNVGTMVILDDLVIDGNGTTTTTGVLAATISRLTIGDPAFTKCTTAITSNEGATILLGSAPVFTTVTTNYSPGGANPNLVKDVSGAGSDDTAIILL